MFSRLPPFNHSVICIIWLISLQQPLHIFCLWMVYNTQHEKKSSLHFTLENKLTTTMIRTKCTILTVIKPTVKQYYYQYLQISVFVVCCIHTFEQARIMRWYMFCQILIYGSETKVNKSLCTWTPRHVNFCIITLSISWSLSKHYKEMTRLFLDPVHPALVVTKS